MENKILYEQLTMFSGEPVIVRKFDYEKFSFPWHVHNEFEIIYVEESFGERFVADSIDKFAPGDLTLVGHNVPHCMKSDIIKNKENNCRVKGTIIQFKEDFMSHAISNYADLAHIKKLLEDSHRGVHFSYPQNKEIIDCINKIYESNGIMHLINLLHLLDIMAQSVNKRFLGSIYFSKSLSINMDSRMIKILSYVTDHYKEDISLNEIASFVAMNSSSFCRYFKEQTGKTLIEYVLDLRVGFACKLLIENKMDVFQIGLECGFNTITHFNRVFKRNTGFAPTEYRKQFLK